LEAVTIKAELQAKSEKLQQAIHQREADEAASAAADVRREGEGKKKQLIFFFKKKKKKCLFQIE
jgi:multidrug resistance efflux pump